MENISGGLPVADIFISYSKQERDLTETLAADLIARGYTVWWDAASLLPGDEFPVEIRREIEEAKAAIVIWSKSSITSKWVKAEANIASDLNKLITVHAPDFDIRLIPMPYNETQSVDLNECEKIVAALAKRGILSGSFNDVGADTPPSRPYSGYRQPYPEPDRSQQAPVPDYRQAPPSFNGPSESRPVEHCGYHDNSPPDLCSVPPRSAEPARAPAYDPQAAYYQGEDLYQNQYAEQPQSNQTYAPPPPPYQAPPQDYGQRDSYRQQAPGQPPMGYGSAPSNGMAQNGDARSRFFLNSGAAPRAPQERAPAPPPLPQTFDFTPASNGNNAAFYAEPEDQTDPGWSHYEPDSMLPAASVAPDRRHADDDLDADFFADEVDFEAAHAYAPEKKGGRLKMVLAVLLGTALVGGGGMYAYKWGIGGKWPPSFPKTVAPPEQTGKKFYDRLEEGEDKGGQAVPAPANSFEDRLDRAMRGGGVQTIPPPTIDPSNRSKRSDSKLITK